MTHFIKNLFFSCHLFLHFCLKNQKKIPNRHHRRSGISLINPQNSIDTIFTIPVKMPSLPFAQAGLLTFGSSYWLRLPGNSNIFISWPVTYCSGRSRLQRWARPRFSRGSLLALFKRTFAIFFKTLNYSRCKVKACLLFDISRLFSMSIIMTNSTKSNKFNTPCFLQRKALKEIYS